MANILIVEDSEFDLSIIRSALGFEHKITWAKSKAEAEAAINADVFDLFVIDIMLGGESGFELCTGIRSQESTKLIPLIILSSKSKTTDKVMGLMLGADDYITKPFDSMEFKARVDRKIKSHQQRQDVDQIRVLGPLRMSLDTASAYINDRGEDKNLDLTPTEFRILWALSKRDSQLFSRNQLIDLAYAETHHVTERTVDSHVRSLRQKLGRFADIIQTVYGTGYRFNVSPLSDLTNNA